MQIEHCLRALIAVLSLTAVFYPVFSQRHFNDTLLLSRSERSALKDDLQGNWYDQFYKDDYSIPDAGRFLKPRENQMLLRQEGRNRTSVDCCPSVLEMVEPEGGKNQDDQYVELYRDGDIRQRFYELSCHRDVLRKPCRFLDKKLHSQSQCVQKYSYTYALVKDPGITSSGGGAHHQRHSHYPSFTGTVSGKTGWTLDYIRVRSGCSCVVTPNAKKKRDKNKRPRHNNNEGH